MAKVLVSVPLFLLLLLAGPPVPLLKDGQLDALALRQGHYGVLLAQGEKVSEAGGKHGA